MSDGKQLEKLKKALRARLHGGAAQVAVEAGELRTVLDELGRLLQSNDRLRRQNRRLRLRLQSAGVAELPDEDAGPGEGDGDGDV